MTKVTAIVNRPATTLRTTDFPRSASPNTAAAYPVMHRAIKTATTVAQIRVAAGVIITATIGRIEPSGNEIIEAIAAA